MQVLIALLRGINVGKAKRVSMEDLRGLLAGLGYAKARTLLNSGNAVFNASGTTARAAEDAARRIAKAIQEKLGVTCRVMVVTAADLALIARENPLLGVADNPSRLQVAVPGARADLALLTPLLKEHWGEERLAVGTAAAYLWCPQGTIASKVVKAVDRALGDSVTMRNWATVLKLRELTAD
jgi:uncharacterized protein (DUF1697 family)